MLQRRLLTRVGLLIAAFVVGAAGAVWALQLVLRDIDRANEDAAFLMDGVQSVDTAANQVQAAAFSSSQDRAALADALRQSVVRLATHPITSDGGAAHQQYQHTVETLPRFLASWEDARFRGTPASVEAAYGAALDMQVSIQELGRAFRAHVATEQAGAGRAFRAMVVTLTIAALVMVNVAVFVLLRTSQMVLRPVSALVEGSRQLAAEHFDHRVSVELRDEFAELAHAYNHLAEQLQASEDRKAEALRQLAVTLNHNLNNAMAIIELQLGLLDRQSGGNPAQAARLREIRASLAQMSQTVASLKHIRRVVLTDYAPGQKMVDLEKSVAEDLNPASPPTTEPFHAKSA
ncbi:MAG: HAMP domain-containing protein [Phycisphaerales bacterium]